MTKFSTNQDFCTPNLVQRLLAPGAASGMSSYKLGASERQMAALAPVFGVDYMGSSEFEYGVFPRSLNEFQEYVRKGKVEVRELMVDARFSKWIDGQERVFSGEKTVYLLSPRKYMNGAENFLKKLATEGEQPGLVEPTHFAEALFAKDIQAVQKSLSASYRPVVGWYDLGNHYFVFTNPETLEKTKQLFGVKESGRLLPREERQRKFADGNAPMPDVS
jgi:hypothetical protein